MDQMLPSPSGYSIPSIGTPLHQPEEDQQIIANNSSYPQYVQHVAPTTMSSGMTPNQIGSGMHSMGLPSLMQTPVKPMNSYTPSYATPQSMIQPQTPVRFFFRRKKLFLILIHSLINRSFFNKIKKIKQQSLMSPMVPMTERTENIHQSMGPATPMTPMTPGDPGILPQLQ